GVPPRRSPVSVDELLERCVAVARLAERQIEWRAERAVERAGARGERVNGRVRRIRIQDVVPRPPNAQVVRDENVGCVQVAQPYDRLGQTRSVIRETRDLGEPA